MVSFCVYWLLEISNTKILEYRAQKKVTSLNVEERLTIRVIISSRTSYSSQPNVVLLLLIARQPEMPAAPTAAVARTVRILLEIL